MPSKIIKCSNCGKIGKRVSILPLCEKCFKKVKNYESFYSKSQDCVQIGLDENMNAQPDDDFMRV
ncbi:MAG: hypothetical protein B6D58_03275 [candidate division Zixibacteria bacterium 4484_95]|nr:MAG: hypothetical protein B6D58_03275 [candidate division Zixibacteria bacterium 4484_95]